MYFFPLCLLSCKVTSRNRFLIHTKCPMSCDSCMYRMIFIYIHCQIEYARQCPAAVTFLKLFEHSQGGFDYAPFVPLAQIGCAKEFKIFRIHTFIGAFVTRYKFTVEYSVHFYTVVLLQQFLYMSEHKVTRVF